MEVFPFLSMSAELSSSCGDVQACTVIILPDT